MCWTREGGTVCSRVVEFVSIVFSGVRPGSIFFRDVMGLVRLWREPNEVDLSERATRLCILFRPSKLCIIEELIAEVGWGRVRFP